MSTFQGVPKYNGINADEFLLKCQTVLNGVLNGKTNNTGTFTLSANTVSSVVTLASGRIGPDTVILYAPNTLNAAAEIGAGTMFVSSRDIANSTFTLTNANNAQTDRIFSFTLTG